MAVQLDIEQRMRAKRFGQRLKLQQLPVKAQHHIAWRQRVIGLQIDNRANGALLSRRRREVSWTLRQLGRSENASAYDAKGQSQQLHTRRSLAVA